MVASWAELVLWWFDMIPLSIIVILQINIAISPGAFQPITKEFIVLSEFTKYPGLETITNDEFKSSLSY